MTVLFFAAICLASFIALSKWRWGVALWFVAAILQDPIRKVTPGTPPYLVVAFVPIYLCTFVGLLSSIPAMTMFGRHHPRLTAPLSFFVASLFISSALTLQHGLAYAPLALVGAFSYAGGVPAVLIGYFFLRKRFDDLDLVLMCFAAVTALMLIGVPLEQSGYKFSLPWLGTINMDGEWRRWYSNTEWVAMISGFYRSPEIMGWHAMALVVVSMYLALRKPSWAWIWVPLSAWGGYAVLMSGRRKMYLMILVFLLVYALVSDRRQRSKMVTYLLVAALVVLPLLSFFVEDAYLNTAESGLAVAGAKASEKGIVGTSWLIGFVGPFGYGVGTKSQGAQHVAAHVKTPLVEGGLEKVLVELGIVGFAAAMFLFATMAWTGWRNVRQARMLGTDSSGPAACFALIAANLSAFLVAFQFFGDPFVITFIGFLVGLLFSTERLLRERTAKTRSPKQADRRTLKEAPAAPPEAILPASYR